MGWVYIRCYQKQWFMEKFLVSKRKKERKGECHTVNSAAAFRSGMEPVSPSDS